MKVYRICVLLVFSILLGVCLGLFIHIRMTADYSMPKITLESDSISIRADGTLSDGLFETAEFSKMDVLFEGVTAYDEKDGDLSDKVFIEDSSNFSEPGVFTITYAVCDSSNHIARAKREVIIENYSAPQIELHDDLVFTTRETISLNNIIGARDVLCGDISSRVILSLIDYEYGKTGTFNINVNVSNSKGDTVFAQLPMTVEDIPSNAPKIELDSYLIYLDKGKAFDPGQHILSAVDSRGDEVSSVSYTSNLDKRKEGLYIVDYYATDNYGIEGHSQLIVIVKGE